MKYIGVLVSFIVYVMMGDVTVGNTVDEGQPSPTDSCALFSYKPNLVSVQDLLDKNVTSGGWFMLYSYEFSDVETYGKCIYKWSQPDADSHVRRHLICYNFELEQCESFDAEVTWQNDECGDATEIAVSDQYQSVGKFYSQDANQYLIYYTCYSYKDSGECDHGYIDTIVRDFRYLDSPDGELNLQGLPWHLMNADLKTNFDLEFSSERMFFEWKGPECGFDGNVITK